jgi:hypothetical protein
MPRFRQVTYQKFDAGLRCKLPDREMQGPITPDPEAIMASSTKPVKRDSKQKPKGLLDRYRELI